MFNISIISKGLYRITLIKGKLIYLGYSASHFYGITAQKTVEIFTK